MYIWYTTLKKKVLKAVDLATVPYTLSYIYCVRVCVWFFFKGTHQLIVIKKKCMLEWIGTVLQSLASPPFNLRRCPFKRWLCITAHCIIRCSPVFNSHSRIAVILQIKNYIGEGLVWAAFITLELWLKHNLLDLANSWALPRCGPSNFCFYAPNQPLLKWLLGGDFHCRGEKQLSGMVTSYLYLCLIQNWTQKQHGEK